MRVENIQTVITQHRYNEIRKAFEETFGHQMSDAEIIVFLADALNQKNWEIERLKGRKL